MGTVSTTVQNRLAKGSASVKGRAPENGEPDHRLAPDAVADGAAGEGADGEGAEIDEEIDLRVLHRNLEMVDEIEGVEAAEARGVDEF